MSYSGCLAIKFLLARDARRRKPFFNRFFYTHGHDKSLWSVANHLADAAGIDSQIYELMADTNPTLAKEVRIIEALPEAPTGPIVVRSDLDPAEKEALRHIFYTMHEDDDLAKAMKLSSSTALSRPILRPMRSSSSSIRRKNDWQERKMRNYTLYVKFNALIVGTIFICGLLTASLFLYSTSEYMSHELDASGKELAVSIGQVVSNDILVDDRFDMTEQLLHAQKTNDQVRYILVTYPDGRILPVPLQKDCQKPSGTAGLGKRGIGTDADL